VLGEGAGVKSRVRHSRHEAHEQEACTWELLVMIDGDNPPSTLLGIANNRLLSCLEKLLRVTL